MRSALYSWKKEVKEEVKKRWLGFGDDIAVPQELNQACRPEEFRKFNWGA